MKKVLFFVLFLIFFGTMGFAQVRIGGNTAPNDAAILDLNANDDATPANNKGALALPRVSLSASKNDLLNGATSQPKGMLVYNTDTATGEGVYYWTGSAWVKASLPAGGTADNYLRGDGTWGTPTDNNTTYSGSTTIALSGTTFSRPAITGDVSIPENSNTAAISQLSATSGQVLKWNGSAWRPADDAGVASVTGSNGITVTNTTTTPVVSLTNGTSAGQVLAWSGTAWTPRLIMGYDYYMAQLSFTFGNRAIAAHAYYDTYISNFIPAGLEAYTCTYNYFSNWPWLFQVYPQSGRDVTIRVLNMDNVATSINSTHTMTVGCPKKQ